MVEAQEEAKIDTNLYSRQIGTYGLEAMGRLIKMKILIVGMRGLGVEVAKDLTLAGPKSVTLYDPNTVTTADRGSNFYIKESDVGNRSRAEACKNQLDELNPHVVVDCLAEFTNDLIPAYDVICITENLCGSERLVEINEICRSSNTGFILSETMGLAGYTFLDYGPEFIVRDKDGEQTQKFMIINIERGQNAKVLCHEDKRHSFQDGDFVKFSEVEGMVELNSLSEPV